MSPAEQMIWAVRARGTYEQTVYVEAASASEARRLVRDGGAERYEYGDVDYHRPAPVREAAAVVAAEWWDERGGPDPALTARADAAP